MKKTLKCIAAVGTLALLGSLCSCGSSKSKNKNDEKAETVFAVNVYEVTSGTLDDYLEFGGSVQTASSVDIYPDVTSGKISRLLVKVGEKVKKDQVLAEVDASRPGMDYKSSPVKAPVSGTITSFPLNVGSTVSAQSSIGKISSTGKLEIKTNVAERFISRISMSQKAELTFDAFPGEKFPAVLTEIDPVLDTTSRTLGVKLLQEPSDSRLRAGMYARIKLITDTKNDVLVIPNNVIVNRNDEDIVYVVDSETSTVKACGVKKGIRVDNKQEILEGLKVGDLIVVKGQALLSDGAKVNLVNKKSQ